MRAGRLRAYLLAFVLLPAAPATARVAPPKLPAQRLTPGAATDDPYVTRVRRELAGFTDWLSANDARGFIGEFGWPAYASDAGRYDAMAERWFADADAAGLWATAWSSYETYARHPHTVYGLPPEATSSGPVRFASSNAVVLERHASIPGRFLRGVNISQGASGFGSVQAVGWSSNRREASTRYDGHNSLPPSPRVFSFDASGRSPLGTGNTPYAWVYNYGTAASFRYLAAHQVQLVRIGFRWERIQRQPGGALDAVEMARLDAAVRAAGQAGLKVILDMHNYAGYYVDNGREGIRYAIGTAKLPDRAFDDVWVRLAQYYAHQPAVLAYDLMNEPTRLSGPRAWERISQSALLAIRASGDRRLVMVPGYNWSKVPGWAQLHPRGWITDPAGNFRYEAHHYWDANGSSLYPRSYAEELVRATGPAPAGFPVMGPRAAPLP